MILAFTIYAFGINDETSEVAYSVLLFCVRKNHKELRILFFRCIDSVCTNTVLRHLAE